MENDISPYFQKRFTKFQDNYPMTLTTGFHTMLDSKGSFSVSGIGDSAQTMTMSPSSDLGTSPSPIYAVVNYHTRKIMRI